MSSRRRQRRISTRSPSILLPRTDRPQRGFIDEVYGACELLALQPQLGHHRRDLTDHPVRFWTVMRRYMIVYRDGSPIEIVRVLSGYRDIANLLA